MNSIALNLWVWPARCQISLRFTIPFRPMEMGAEKRFFLNTLESDANVKRLSSNRKLWRFNGKPIRKRFHAGKDSADNNIKKHDNKKKSGALQVSLC